MTDTPKTTEADTARRLSPEAWEAILQLTHRLDDAAQGITELQVYDFATAIRVQLGLDGEEVAAEARVARQRGYLGATPWGEVDDH